MAYNLFQQFINIYLNARRSLSAILYHLLEIARHAVLLLPKCAHFVQKQQVYSDKEKDVPKDWHMRNDCISSHLKHAFDNEMKIISKWHQDVCDVVLNELKQMRKNRGKSSEMHLIIP